MIAIKDISSPPIHVEVNYPCSVTYCNVVHKEVIETYLNWEIYKVRKPEGWREISGMLICPAHKKVELLVDGFDKLELP